MPKTSFPCDTGNASWNGEETGITCTIETGDKFTTEDADEMLLDQRLDLALRITPADGEDPKQKKLVDDAHASVRVTTDIHGYSRTPGEVTFRVKIPKDKMNGFHSDDFGPGKAILTVHGWGPIPEKAKVKSKAADGQRTFEDHADLGPRPVETGKPAQDKAASKKGHPKAAYAPPLKAPTKAQQQDAFTRGATAALTGLHVEVSDSDVKAGLAEHWQAGYDRTQAER